MLVNQQVILIYVGASASATKTECAQGKPNMKPE